MERNRSFNLPDGNIPFGTTIAVGGNGKTLGLKTNTNDAGVILLGSGAVGNVGSYLRASISAYNTSIGTAGTYNTVAGTDSTSVGVTQDFDKSGLVVDLSSAATVIIKY